MDADESAIEGRFVVKPLVDDDLDKSTGVFNCLANLYQ